MHRPSIFDRRMLDAISDFYPSKVNIIMGTTEPDDFGSPVVTSEDLLVGIEAAIAPFNDIIPISGERKLENLSYNTATYRIGLKGYYPTITTKMIVEFPDGKQYNILGAEFDSHHKTTRLIVNEVTI